MAAYAAYRHVELDHVGYGKKRVLKPPGGGSSDIFGAAETQQSPRKVKQYMASNITLTDGPAPPSGTGPGSTSSAASTTSSGETSPSPPSGSPTRNEGNPVTGEGYTKPAGPVRNRVPPGGYSSGLW